MRTHSLETEEYREYDFNGRVYKIEYPKSLITIDNGTTHRVVDQSGIVHCVPAPGFCGCVLRWKSKDGLDAVAF